jgi:hypothetical protein
MRFVLIGIISLLFFSSKAQVKEVHFLGKNWYLHGIDARLTLPNYKTNATLKAFEKNHQQLFSAIENEYNYSSNVKLSSDNFQTGFDYGFSAGLVFRPFTKVESKLLQSTEIIHNFGLRKEDYRYIWDELIVYGTIVRTSDARYQNSMAFYQPSINLSTKTIANRIKFYGGLDLRFATSNSTSFTVKRYAAEYVFPNNNTDPRSDLQINLSKASLGAGYTAGLKFAATCNFNVHCEIKDIYQTTWYRSNNYHFPQRITQLNFGFRYKFNAPDDEGNSAEDIQSVFW